MEWTNICIEGFCMADTDEKGNAPCGDSCTSHCCLKNGMCPHFGYAETTERDVASHPRLRLILKDRFGIWLDNAYCKARWLLWDQLSFNQRKTDDFLKSITTIEVGECPELDEQLNVDDKKFKKWFKKASKE